MYNGLWFSGKQLYHLLFLFNYRVQSSENATLCSTYRFIGNKRIWRLPYKCSTESRMSVSLLSKYSQTCIKRSSLYSQTCIKRLPLYSQTCIKRLPLYSQTCIKRLPLYSQTCIKKSPLGQRKSGLIRQVTT